MQEPEEEKVFKGHVEVHLPVEARRLEEQVRQKVDDPAQVKQEESQAV